MGAQGRLAAQLFSSDQWFVPGENGRRKDMSFFPLTHKEAQDNSVN